MKRLIQEGAEINKLCIEFNSTPLFWTIHGYISCGRKNLEAFLECSKLLLEAGADTTIPNFEGYTIFDLLKEEDWALKNLLDSYQ